MFLRLDFVQTHESGKIEQYGPIFDRTVEAAARKSDDRVQHGLWSSQGALIITGKSSHRSLTLELYVGPASDGRRIHLPDPASCGRESKLADCGGQTTAKSPEES